MADVSDFAPYNLKSLKRMNLSEKDIRTLRSISTIAIVFTMIVALTMIFSLVQLKLINPLENPVLLEIKEQYDRDPTNNKYAEQIRAIDLMARKAYFSSRWQIETGSYLLLAGAIVFIICQRLISAYEKTLPVEPGVKPDLSARKRRIMNSLLTGASVIFITAVIASFGLRKNLSIRNIDRKPKIVREKKAGTEPFIPDITNYPFFRGQDSRGIAGGSGYPLKWNGTEGVNVKWKTEIPKEGKSSPVIWGDKIFVTGAEGLQCEIYCMDKNSGDIIWTASGSDIPGEPEEPPQMDMESGMAVSTVATNGREVCAIFANGNLVCTDMDGRIKWSKNIGVPENIYGYSSSLIIYNNTLLLQYDDDNRLSLMGFDTGTGELKWETMRKGRPSWASPVLGNFNGSPHLVINGNPYVTGFDPETGKELWAVECMTGDVAPSVALNSTLVYAVTDYSRLAAIRPGPGASIVWEDNYFTPDVSSPVATDELLFLSTGNGDVACYNAQTGDTLWTRWYTEQFYASPVIAGEMVYFLDRSGMMRIVRAASEYELVAESPLGEPTDCTPAFSDKEIFIRTTDKLYCISEN